MENRNLMENKNLMDNRNLYRTNDTNRKQKLLKHGRLPVVSFISEMPQTSHYLHTFTMDISLITVRSYFFVNKNKMCNLFVVLYSSFIFLGRNNVDYSYWTVQRA